MNKCFIQLFNEYLKETTWSCSDSSVHYTSDKIDTADIWMNKLLKSAPPERIHPDKVRKILCIL